MKALQDPFYDLLHGDATLLATAVGDVHNRLAPPGTPFPYCVFQFLESRVERTLQGRMYEVFPFQVRVVDEGFDPVNVETGKARLVTLLEGAALVVTGYSVWWVHVTGEMPDYVEIDDAGRALQHGGVLGEIAVAPA